MSPYRTLPPAPRLAPRTPWHRLAWALCSGAIAEIEFRQARQRVAGLEWLRHRRIARSFAVFLILYAVWSAAHALMEVIRVVK